VGAGAVAEQIETGATLDAGEREVTVLFVDIRGYTQFAERMIWSALGNTTNLAARLQALTRELDVAAVIDEATWREAGPRKSSFERRAALRIRGLDEPRDVFVAIAS
jgi:class 3 adenylate cyclase